MKLFISVLTVFSLAVCPLIAGNPEEKRTDSQDNPEARQEAIADRVLSLVPENPFAVVYIEDCENFLRGESRALAPIAPPALCQITELWCETFQGPLLVSANGWLINPASWQITLATGLKENYEHLVNQLDAELIPLLRTLAEDAGLQATISLTDLGDRAKLSFSFSTIPEIVLEIAVRDGLVVISNNYSSIEASSVEDEQLASFLDTDEMSRLTSGFDEHISRVLYVDVRQLMPLVGMFLNRSLPQLHEALQLDLVESVAIIESSRQSTTSKSRRSQAEPEVLHSRIAVGLREQKSGLWRFLASKPASPDLASMFPADTNVFIHGSMETMAETINDLLVIADTVDPVIANEYRTECAEFLSDVGFHPHNDFLANIAGEWAIGFRLRESDGDSSTAGTNSPMLIDDLLFALKLASPSDFNTQMHSLKIAFGLESTSSEHAGITLHHALREAGRFSYAVVDSVLLVAPQPQLIARAIDASKGKGSLTESSPYIRATKQISSPSSKLAVVDVSELIFMAIRAMGIEQGEELIRLAQQQLSVGVTISPHDRAIALDTYIAARSIQETANLTMRWLATSAQKAQLEAKRMHSMGRVKQLLMGCHIYSQNHKAWPESPEDLAEEGTIGQEPYAPGGLCVIPYDETTPYLFLHVPDFDKDKISADKVVICEPYLHDGGAVFGFMDGHVEWITGVEAEQLLADMHQSQ